jgi:hypothetical protein
MAWRRPDHDLLTPAMILHTGSHVASCRPDVSPTTRRPGGSLRRDREQLRAALPPGRRVVALREVDRMPHPVLTPGPARAGGRPSWRPARPARACFVWDRAALADVTPLRQRRPAASTVKMADELLKR